MSSCQGERNEAELWIYGIGIGFLIVLICLSIVMVQCGFILMSAALLDNVWGDS